MNMSNRFQQVYFSNNPKTKDTLQRVLHSIVPGSHKTIESIFATNPSASDDDIFVELSKCDRKSDGTKSYNKYKLVAAVSCIHRRNIARLRSTMNILDYGGGNGSAAAYLANYLKVENIHVADVHIPLQLEDQKSKSRVKFTKLETNKPLLFSDNQFDVVFCMMTLHHIKDVERALKEIHRVCRKWLIIQEHDATPEFAPILDIVHGMYIFVKNENDFEDIKKMADFQAWYDSVQGWDEKLSKAGFEYQWMKRTRSAQNNYYALYKKRQT